MKLIIGFDGLHRSGKGTQISLLQSKLDKINAPSLVARGDGTRRGTGSSAFDYPSTWWKERWDYFQDKSNGSFFLDNANLKFQRLNREAKFYFYKCLEKEMKRRKSDLGVMIMDRTLPSRYLTLLSFCQGISFEDSIKSYNPKNGLFVPPMTPDLVFIMHAPKEILLKRLEETTKSPKDYHCKINIISKYYDSFESVAKSLSGREGYSVLDSTRDPEELSDEIWGKVSQLITDQYN